MRLILLPLCTGLIWAAPINMTIDELLKNETKKELEVPSYDPFQRTAPLLQKKSTKIKTYKPLPIELSAILNEKALINGKWYKKGDLTPEGRVIKVTKSAVHIKKKTKTKILQLQKSIKSRFKVTLKDAE